MQSSHLPFRAIRRRPTISSSSPNIKVVLVGLILLFANLSGTLFLLASLTSFYMLASDWELLMGLRKLFFVSTPNIGEEGCKKRTSEHNWLLCKLASLATWTRKIGNISPGNIILLHRVVPRCIITLLLLLPPLRLLRNIRRRRNPPIPRLTRDHLSLLLLLRPLLTPSLLFSALTASSCHKKELAE